LAAVGGAMSQPPARHPHPERLRAFRLGILPEAEQDEIVEHLEVCPDCCDLLEVCDDPFFVRLRTRSRTEIDDSPAAAGHPATDPVTDRDTAHPLTGQPAEPGSGPPPPTAFTIPGYEVRRELGRGGIGVVYQARCQKLRREVALKVLLAGAHAGPAELARFRVEAETVARLQHPNIVQIHEVGTHEGLPYFVLEYVEGGTLAEWSTRQSPAKADVYQIAALVETVAHAVHHAHQRGHPAPRPETQQHPTGTASGGC
jgi:hypothetical protein